MKKYLPALGMWLLFETVAVSLWLALGRVFYLLNFSYIGTALALGLALYAAGWRYARHVVQFAVGLYMLVYLGLICRENMQIEGFWYYLFLGVFEAAVIHYAVAKLFGPLVFGRGWCGYACWTAMVLGFRDNRAFCKYVCPVSVFLRLTGRFALFRVRVDSEKCVSCGRCAQVCPMDIRVHAAPDPSECILCLRCVETCPKGALRF